MSLVTFVHNLQHMYVIEPLLYVVHRQASKQSVCQAAPCEVDSHLFHVPVEIRILSVDDKKVWHWYWYGTSGPFRFLRMIWHTCPPIMDELRGSSLWLFALLCSRSVFRFPQTTCCYTAMWVSAALWIHMGPMLHSAYDVTLTCLPWASPISPGVWLTSKGLWIEFWVMIREQIFSWWKRRKS